MSRFDNKLNYSNLKKFQVVEKINEKFKQLICGHWSTIDKKYLFWVPLNPRLGYVFGTSLESNCSKFE